MHPPWDKLQDKSGKQLIEIEPGMAFGTGQHATTQICLRAIEDLDPNVTVTRFLMLVLVPVFWRLPYISRGIDRLLRPISIIQQSKQRRIMLKNNFQTRCLR